MLDFLFFSMLDFFSWTLDSWFWTLDLEFKGKINCQKKNAGTLPAKPSFSLLLGLWAWGELSRIFFSAFLEFVPDFQKTNVYEPNFATFFGDFHFITLIFCSLC